ncbi:hypothetical protein TGFOU_208910 [Toxoplasma gondii FOU]|uniref:Uncharacterized protein n=1 Tax=Toxoplasma gondii FOU TaxID=943167 RepID=A0A086KYR6_TOXGO|nr:hypothetical protein TGFOU_208910 [Toxoplasma gondii FOU]
MEETILRFRATPPSCRPLFGIDKDKPTPDPLPLCSSDRARGGRQKTPTTKCSPGFSSIVTSVSTCPLTNAENSDGYKGKEEVWERRWQSDMYESARRSSPRTAQTPSSTESHFSRQVDRLAYISSSSSATKTSLLSHSFVTRNTASTSARAGNLSAPVQLLQLQRSLSSVSLSDSLQASHRVNASFTSNVIDGVPTLRPRGFPHSSSSPSTSPYRCSSFSVNASLPGSPSTSATSPPNPRGKRKDTNLRFHDCRDQLFSEQKIRLPLHLASSPSFTTSQRRKNSPPPSVGPSPSSECLSSSPISCQLSSFPSVPSARGTAASQETTSVERSSEETRVKKTEETGCNKQEGAGIGAAPSEQEHMGRREGAAEAEREAPEPWGRRGQAISETISRIRALREIGKERRKREGVQVVQAGEAGETVGTALRFMFRNQGKDRSNVWKRRQQETVAGLHGANAQKQTQREAEDGGYACDYRKETTAFVLRFQPNNEPRLDRRQKEGKLYGEQNSRETGIKADPHFRTSEQVTQNGERSIQGKTTEETCEGNRKGDTGEVGHSGEGSKCGEKKEDRETTVSRGFDLPVEKKERGKQVTYRGSEETETPRQRMAEEEFDRDGPTVMVPEESFSLRSGTQLSLESAACAAHDRVQTDPFSPLSIKSVHSSSTECYPPSLHHPVSPCSTRSFHSSFATSSPSAFPLSPAFRGPEEASCSFSGSHMTAGVLTSVDHREAASLRCSQSSEAKGGEENQSDADITVLSTKALSAAASPLVPHSSSVCSPAIPVALDYSFSYTASCSPSGKPQKETEPASKGETASAGPTQFVSVEGRDSSLSSHALCSSRELSSKSRHEAHEGERMCADNLPPSIVSPPTEASQRSDPPVGSPASRSSAFSSSPCFAVHAGEDEGQCEWKNMSLDSASVCVSRCPDPSSGFSCPSPLDRKSSANSETKPQAAASQYSPVSTIQAKPFIGETQKTNGSDKEGGVMLEQGILSPQQTMATPRRGNAEIFHPGKANESVCRQTEAETASSPQTPSQSRSTSCSKQEGINTPCDICLSPRFPVVEERETAVLHEEGKESRVISSLPDRGAPSCTPSSSAPSFSLPSFSSWPSSLSPSSSAAGIESSSVSVSELESSSCSRLVSSSSSASGVDLTSFFPSLPYLASAASGSSDLSPCSSSPSSVSSQEGTHGPERDSDTSERVDWTRKVDHEFDSRNELQEKKMRRGRPSFPCVAFPLLDQCSVKAAEALSFLFVFPASAYDVTPERITESRGRTAHQAPPSSPLSPSSPAPCRNFNGQKEAAQSCSSLSSDIRTRDREGGDRDSRVEGQRLDSGDLYDGNPRNSGSRGPQSEREETQTKGDAVQEEAVLPKDDREAQKLGGKDGEWEDGDKTECPNKEDRMHNDCLAHSCAPRRSPSPSGATPSLPFRSSLSSPSSALAPPSPVSDSQAHSPSSSSLSPSPSSPLSICGSSVRRRYPSLPSVSLQSSLPLPAPASPAAGESPRKRADKDDSDRRRMNEEPREKEGEKEAEPEGEAAAEGNKEAMERARGVWRETDILTEVSGWKEGMLLQEPEEKEDEQEKASKPNAQVGDGAIEKGQQEEINREGANAEEEARERSRQNDEEQFSSKGNRTQGSLEPSSGSSVILLPGSELTVTEKDTREGLDSSSSPIEEPSAAPMHILCFKKRSGKASGKLTGRKKPQVQVRSLLLRPRKRRPEKRDKGELGVEVAAIEQEEVRRESETETPESVKSGTASEKVGEGRQRVDEARELVSERNAQEGIKVAKTQTQQREKERKGSETESDASEKEKQRMMESAAGNTGDEDHEKRELKTKGDSVKENKEAEGDPVAAMWHRSQSGGETGGEEWPEQGSAEGESDKEEGQGKRFGKANGGEQMIKAELKAEEQQVGTNPGDERQEEQGLDRDASQEGEASDSDKGLDSRGNAEVLETTRVPTDEELTISLFPKDDAGADGENLAACAFEATPQETDPTSASFPLCYSSTGEDQPQRLLPSLFPLHRSEEEQTLPSLSPSSALGQEAPSKRQTSPVSASSLSQKPPECGGLTNIMSCFSSTLEKDVCCPVSCPPCNCIPSEIEANGGKPDGACHSPRDTEKLAGENPTRETSLAVSQFSHAELVAFVHGLLEKAIESPQVVCKVKKVLLQEIEEREKRKLANTEKGQTGDRRQHKDDAKEEREAAEECEEAGGEGKENRGESEQKLKDGEKKNDGSEGTQKEAQAKAEKRQRVKTQEHKEKKQNIGGNKEEETMLNDGEKGQGKTAEREKEWNKDKGDNAGRKSTTRPVTKRRGDRAEESKEVDHQSEIQSSGKVEEGRELRPRRKVNMQRLEELHREAFEKQRRNRERAEAIARDEALRLEQEKAVLKRRLAPPRPKKQEGKTVARFSSNDSSGQGRIPEGASASIAARREGESVEPQEERDDHHLDGPPLPVQSASRLLDTKHAPETLPESEAEDRERRSVPGGNRDSSLRNREVRGNGEGHRAPSVSPSLPACPVAQTQDRSVPADEEAEKPSVEHAAGVLQGSLQPQWDKVERFLDTVDARAALLGSQIAEHAAKPLAPVQSDPSDVTASMHGCSSRADEPKTIRLLRLLEEQAFAAAVDVLRGLRSSGEALGDSGECMRVEGTSWDELDLLSATFSAKGKNSTSWSTRGAITQKATRREMEARQKRGEEREGTGTQEGRLRGDKQGRICRNKDGRRSVTKEGGATVEEREVEKERLGQSKTESSSCTCQLRGIGGLAANAAGRSQILKQKLSISASPVVASSVQVLGCSHHSRIRSHTNPQRNENTVEGIQRKNVDSGKKENSGSEKREANHSCSRPRKPQGSLRVTNHEEKAAKPCKSSAASSSQSSLPAWKPAGVAAVKPPPQERLPKIRSSSCSSLSCSSLSGRPVASVCNQQATREASRRGSAMPRRPQSPFSPLRFSFLSPETETQWSLHAQEREGLAGAKLGSRILEECNAISTPTHLRRRSSPSLRYACPSYAFSEREIPVWRPAGLASRSPTPLGGGKVFCRVENARKTRSSSRLKASPASLVRARESPRNEKDGASSRSRFSSLSSSFSASKSRASLVRAASLHCGPSAERRRRKETTADNGAKIYPKNTYMPYGSERREGTANALAEARSPNEVEVPNLHAERPRQVLSSVASVDAFRTYAKERTGPSARSYRAVPTTETQLEAEQESFFSSRKETQCIEAKDRKSEKRVDKRDCFLGRNCSDQQNRNSLSASSEGLPQERRPILSPLPSSTSAACSPGVSLSCLAAKKEHGKAHDGEPKCCCLPCLPATSLLGPPLAPGESLEEKADHFLQWVYADQLQRQKKGRYLSPTARVAEGRTERGTESYREDEEARIVMGAERAKKGSVYSREGSGSGNQSSSALHAKENESFEGGREAGRAAFTLTRRLGFPFDSASLEPFSFDRVESIMEKITEMEELMGLRKQEGI